MSRAYLVLISALGCVSSTPDAAVLSCDETAARLDPDESTTVGLTAEQAVASFPSVWEVSWARFGEDPTATPLSNAQDTVGVDLVLVSAEEVVSHSDAGWCPANGTTFLRLGVTGGWVAGNGLTSGALEGVLQIETEDPLTWAVHLSAPSLTLSGADRDQAEQFAAEAGIVDIEAFRGAVVAHWQGAVRPLDIGLDVVGERADGGSMTHGLWGSASATPAE